MTRLRQKSRVVARFGRGGRATDVLIVCTGNICRSPYVTGILRQAVPGIRIATAGTHAVAAGWAAPDVVAALEEAGAPPPDLARQLTRRDLRRARLIVTMTRAQRGDVLHRLGSVGDRTYTLKEVARAAASGRADGSVDGLLAALRTQTAGHPIEGDDDLADPYGGPPEAYATMFREADAAVRAITAALTAASVTSPGQDA